MRKTVQKRKAELKLSMAERESELGLWVDYELLRKHQGRPAQTVLHAQSGASDNHYLHLADLALKPKPKKKPKSDRGN